MRTLLLVLVVLSGCTGLMPGLDTEPSSEDGLMDSAGNGSGDDGAADTNLARAGDARVVDGPDADGDAPRDANDASYAADADTVDSAIGDDSSRSDASIENDASSNDVSSNDDGSSDAFPDVSLEDGPHDGSDADATLEDGPHDGSDASCVDACEEGSLRCDVSGGFVCERRSGCSAWVRRVVCAAGDFCCATDGLLACVTPDAFNCFACGIVCSGQMPVCSSATKRCACNSSSCAIGTGCDDVTGTCICAKPASDAADFYVDIKSPVAGTGTAACPVRTIGEGLTLASASSASTKIVHIAAGDYALETFPLLIRGGITLQGVGADVVTITGMGEYHTDLPTPLTHRATAVIGEASRDNAIRGLTIRAGEEVRIGNAGVIVEDGNFIARDGGPLEAAPNTFVSDAVIGPGFNVGLQLSARLASRSRGNIRIENTLFTGGWASIYTSDCGPAAPWLFGNIEIRRSTFSGQTRGLSGIGGGMEVHGCVSLDIRETTFQDSIWGLLHRDDVPDPSLRSRTRYLSNTFTRLQLFGLYTDRSQVDELSGNTFSSIVKSSEPLAKALVIQDGSIARARNNTFLGNDSAVLIHPSGELNATHVYDFGTVGDPGNNDFRCNSARLSSIVVYAGFDVAVDGPASGWTFPLYGNRWDHAPPHFFSSPDSNADNAPSTVDGTDLFIGWGNAASVVDVGGATLSSSVCPVDHEPGPTVTSPSR
jgi:hypothetical protein